MAVYSLYGNQTISSGSKVTPFGYQGSYTDSTGLIYLINRYYDPATDQFLSIDPAVATTDQPYTFSNDNPLNFEDPLGLKIQGTGSAACNIRSNDTGDIRTFECNGVNSNGTSAVGITIATPPVAFSVLVGYVVVTSSVSITGAYGVSFGSDGVTVSAGGATETFGADGSINGSFDLPGASGLSFSGDGLSLTTTQKSKLPGGVKIDAQSTATFHLEGTPPAPAYDYALGGAVVVAGFGALAPTAWIGTVTGIAKSLVNWCFKDEELCFAPTGG
jgi:RHS repeat-associated protein